MTRIQCPKCQEVLDVPEDMADQVWLCPVCQQRFAMPHPRPLAHVTPAAPPTPPAPVIPIVSVSSSVRRSRATRRTYRTPGQRIVLAGCIGAAVVAALGVPFGFMSSQFFPLFGGFVAAIAEPFSPYRLQLVPVHCFAFAIAGAVLGFVIGSIVRYLRDAS